MTEVVSVKFKDTGKAYFFAPNGKDLKVGSKVIVETQNGNELGIIAVANHQVNDDDLVSPLKKVLRVANEKDLKRVEENKKKAVDALKICEELVAQHGLDMKLVEVEYSFDGSKIVFFFTSDGRVDFRELVRDLAARFHTRIELRQIGVRDEAKLLGGLGICGQPYCCKRFLSDFQPVSIKMAKEQNLSLNSMKISGQCGRLLCCLSYEYEWYSEARKQLPSEGLKIYYDGTNFRIQEVNPLTRMVKMSGEDGRLLEIAASRFVQKDNRWVIQN